jgi:hypothetical protein
MRLVYTIRLEEENGSVIDKFEADMEALTRLLPSRTDGDFKCLCFVDPYDNASFNHHQMENMRSEISLLRERHAGPEAISILDNIDRLVKQRAIHTYLKFYGD